MLNFEKKDLGDVMKDMKQMVIEYQEIIISF